MPKAEKPEEGYIFFGYTTVRYQKGGFIAWIATKMPFVNDNQPDGVRESRPFVDR